MADIKKVWLLYLLFNHSQVLVKPCARLKTAKTTPETGAAAFTVLLAHLNLLDSEVEIVYDSYDTKY